MGNSHDKEITEIRKTRGQLGLRCDYLFGISEKTGVLSGEVALEDSRRRKEIENQREPKYIRNLEQISLRTRVLVAAAIT